MIVCPVNYHPVNQYFVLLPIYFGKSVTYVGLVLIVKCITGMHTLAIDMLIDV